MGKFGFSFSAKHALGITKARQKIARTTGIPTTKAGLQRKAGKHVLGLGLVSSRSRRRASEDPQIVYVERRRPRFITRLFRSLFLIALGTAFVVWLMVR
jgi:hypothetical protein